VSLDERISEGMIQILQCKIYCLNNKFGEL